MLAALVEALPIDVARARARLRRHMESQGMCERDGWRIVESRRERDRIVQIVLRPARDGCEPSLTVEAVVSLGVGPRSSELPGT